MQRVWAGLAPAPEDVRFERRHTVEEEYTVEVVDLVQERTRFEAVGTDDASGAVQVEAAHLDLSRATHVGCEIGDRETPLACDLGPRLRRDHGVEQHHQPVAGKRARMVRHVEDDAATKLADLVGGEADASFVGPQGVDEIASEGAGRIVDDAHGFGYAFEDGVRVDPDGARGHGDA